MINPKLKKLLDVMRSPQYIYEIPIAGALNLCGTYCAMGLACEVYRQITNDGEWICATEIRKSFKCGNEIQNYNPPDCVIAFFDLGDHLTESIIRWSDYERLSFGCIADKIQGYLG